MLHLARYKKKREYQYEERQHICHDPEQSHAYIMHSGTERAGRIHYHGNKEEQRDSEKRDAPYHVNVPAVVIVLRLHLSDAFEFFFFRSHLRGSLR